MFQKNDLASYDGAEDFLCQEHTRNLFGQPDVLLLHEYLHVHQSSLAHTPEVKLMLAVLKDGIDCYLKYVSVKQRRARKLSDEAEQWFFSNEDDWLYSFESVCDILNLDPDYIRRALLRYKQQHTEPGNHVGSRAASSEPPVDNLRLAS